MDGEIAAILAMDGIASGAIYVLIGLGLVLIFAVTRVIFVPFGDIAAFTALSLASLENGTRPGTIGLVVALAVLATVVEAIALVRAHAFGTEEHQAKSRQREMQRHRDREQQQYRSVGDRPEHDAVEQRCNRQHEGERQSDPARHRQGRAREQPDRRGRQEGQDEIEQQGPRQAGKGACPHERDHFDGRRQHGERNHEADRARSGAALQGSQAEGGEGCDISERHEDHACDREDQNQPQADQDIDCPAGDAIHRQDRCDLAVHRAVLTVGTSTARP